MTVRLAWGRFGFQGAGKWCRLRDSNPDPLITNEVLYQLS